MPTKPTKTRPFPEPYPTSIVADAELQAALDAAIAAGPGKTWRVPLSIVSLDPDGRRPAAHWKGGEVHFSASLLKVAAMYSAFELRNTLQAIAQELGTGARKPDLLKVCAAYLDPRIMAKVDTISTLKGIRQIHALPRYADAFEAVAATSAQQGPISVRFTAEFTKHLEKMIAVSDNRSAAQCVYGSGYGYLNVALAAAGFFDAKTKKGIWLAGDYVRSYPYFRIPSENDGLVAQGATTQQLARMYTLLHDGKLVSAAASAEMMELLAKAVAVPEVFIDRAANINFKVTHTKVGLGPLKKENGGESVYSEGSILEHTSKRKFVVVWQNLVCGNEYFDPLARVVCKTLDTFLARRTVQATRL